jgi:hypothetical protein
MTGRQLFETDATLVTSDEAMLREEGEGAGEVVDLRKELAAADRERAALEAAEKGKAKAPASPASAAASTDHADSDDQAHDG